MTQTYVVGGGSRFLIKEVGLELLITFYSNEENWTEVLNNVSV